MKAVLCCKLLQNYFKSYMKSLLNLRDFSPQLKPYCFYCCMSTVDYQHSETSITPLMIASGRGFTEVVAQLLNMGADAHGIDS